MKRHRYIGLIVSFGVVVFIPFFFAVVPAITVWAQSLTPLSLAEEIMSNVEALPFFAAIACLSPFLDTWINLGSPVGCGAAIAFLAAAAYLSIWLVIMVWHKWRARDGSPL